MKLGLSILLGGRLIGSNQRENLELCAEDML